MASSLQNFEIEAVQLSSQEKLLFFIQVLFVSELKMGEALDPGCDALNSMKHTIRFWSAKSPLFSINRRAWSGDGGLCLLLENLEKISHNQILVDHNISISVESSEFFGDAVFGYNKGEQADELEWGVHLDLGSDGKDLITVKIHDSDFGLKLHRIAKPSDAVELSAGFKLSWIAKLNLPSFRKSIIPDLYEIGTLDLAIDARTPMPDFSRHLTGKVTAQRGALVFYIEDSQSDKEIAKTSVYTYSQENRGENMSQGEDTKQFPFEITLGTLKLSLEEVLSLKSGARLVIPVDQAVEGRVRLAGQDWAKVLITPTEDSIQIEIEESVT